MSSIIFEFSENFIDKLKNRNYNRIARRVGEFTVYHMRLPVKANSRIWDTDKNLGNWRDKAGAYGIQEPFGAYAVKRIEGDYFNAVGLPVSRLYCTLKELELI